MRLPPMASTSGHRGHLTASPGFPEGPGPIHRLRQETGPSAAVSSGRRDARMAGDTPETWPATLSFRCQQPSNLAAINDRQSSHPVI